MTETHPFGFYVPDNAKYLILGSFAAKPENGYDWFYSNGRNQFWKIIGEVYGTVPANKTDQQKLLTKLHFAMADLIESCDRKKFSSLDSHLTNLVFNFKGINNILASNKIRKIYFSSRFTENLFRKHFKDTIKKYPDIELITLPSPSPRYAALTLKQKILSYKKLLPE